MQLLSLELALFTQTIKKKIECLLFLVFEILLQLSNAIRRWLMVSVYEEFKEKLYISQSHKADQTSRENRPRRRTDAGEFYARKS